MKERVEKILKGLPTLSIADCICCGDYAWSQKHLVELIKDLWAENQALKAEREGILGANEINKLFVEELEENQLIAIKALENARNFLVVHMGVHRNIVLHDVEQALSKIRGK